MGKPFRDRLVYKAEVIERAGQAYQTILNDIRSGLFAEGRVIAGKTAWLESEFLAYLDRLPRRKYDGIKHNRSVVRPTSDQSVPQ